MVSQLHLLAPLFLFLSLLLPVPLLCSSSPYTPSCKSRKKKGYHTCKPTPMPTSSTPNSPCSTIPSRNPHRLPHLNSSHLVLVLVLALGELTTELIPTPPSPSHHLRLLQQAWLSACARVCLKHPHPSLAHSHHTTTTARPQRHRLALNRRISLAILAPGLGWMLDT